MLDWFRRVISSGWCLKGWKLCVLIGCCWFSSFSRSYICVFFVMSYIRNMYVKLLINWWWVNWMCDWFIVNVFVVCWVSISVMCCFMYVLFVLLMKKIKSVVVFCNIRIAVLLSMYGLLMVWSCWIINVYYWIMNIIWFVSYNLWWREYFFLLRIILLYLWLGNLGYFE